MEGVGSCRKQKERDNKSGRVQDAKAFLFFIKLTKNTTNGDGKQQHNYNRQIMRIFGEGRTFSEQKKKRRSSAGG